MEMEETLAVHAPQVEVVAYTGARVLCGNTLEARVHGRGQNAAFSHFCMYLGSEDVRNVLSADYDFSDGSRIDHHLLLMATHCGCLLICHWLLCVRP